MTRLRSLIDHGLNNWDPLISGHNFIRSYHTNLYHAVLASCAQLTGQETYMVWGRALPWAKLMNAAGAYFLTQVTFRHRPAAWIAATFVVGQLFAMIFLTYPNQLAPYYISSYALGFFVLCWRSQRDFKPVWMLALSVWVVAQVHGLYAVFLILALAPILLVRSVVRLLRGGWSTFRVQVAALTALAAAVPFLLVSKYTSSVTRLSVTPLNLPPHVQFPTDNWNPPTTEQVLGYEALRDFVSPNVLTLRILVIPMLIAVLLSNKRARAYPLLTVFLSVTAGLFWPVTRNLIEKCLGGHEWAITRMEHIVFTPFAALLAGGILTSFRRWGNAPAVHIVVATLLLVFAFLPRSRDLFESNINNYLTYAASHEVAQNPKKEALSKQKRFLELCVPKGSVVLSPFEAAPNFSMLHDLTFITAHHHSPGIADMKRRKTALALLWSRDVDVEPKRKLLQEYRVTHLVSYGSADQIEGAGLQSLFGHVKQAQGILCARRLR